MTLNAYTTLSIRTNHPACHNLPIWLYLLKKETSMNCKLQQRTRTPWSRAALACSFESLGITILSLAFFLSVAVVAFGVDPPHSKETLWKKLEPFTQPPAEFAEK